MLTLYFIFILIGKRSTTSADSKIIFNIPIHLMNLNSIRVGVKRDIAISLYIGDTKMWAGFQEFTIQAADADVLNPTPNDITLDSGPTLLNTGSISVGDGAVFRVVVNVPSGWSNFNTELVGATSKDSDKIIYHNTSKLLH